MSPRLYIITGKGGVGKSSYALAFALKLKSEGKKVLYNSFDQDPYLNICKTLDVDHFELSIDESAEIYISRKVKSKQIAKWITKTAFFKSLFNMIPGLADMILFGHLIDKLENDKELIIILDSPSSGHALTMLEASHNFKEIFGKGLIVKDIDKMHDFIYQQNCLKTIIISLPSPMSLNESHEVRAALNDLKIINNEVIINDCYSEIPEILNSTLPIFLDKKIEMEKKVLAANKEKFTLLPHLPYLLPTDIITRLSALIGSHK